MLCLGANAILIPKFDFLPWLKGVTFGALTVAGGVCRGCGAVGGWYKGAGTWPGGGTKGGGITPKAGGLGIKPIGGGGTATRPSGGGLSSPGIRESVFFLNSASL